MKSDIEIAQETKMAPPLSRWALHLSDEEDLGIGKYKAKVSLTYGREFRTILPGKLVLVTAITPYLPPGEGQNYYYGRIRDRPSTGSAKSHHSPAGNLLWVPALASKGEPPGRIFPGSTHGRHQPAFYRGYSCGQHGP